MMMMQMQTKQWGATAYLPKVGKQACRHGHHMGEPPRRLTTLADEHNDQRNDEVLGARFTWCSLLTRQRIYVCCLYNPTPQVLASSTQHTAQSPRHAQCSCSG